MWIEWRGIEGGRQQPHYEEQPQTEKKEKGECVGIGREGECGGKNLCVRPRRYAGGDCLISAQCGGEVGKSGVLLAKGKRAPRHYSAAT